MFDINTLLIIVCNCAVYGLVFYKKYRDERNERTRNEQHDQMWKEFQSRKRVNGRIQEA